MSHHAWLIYKRTKCVIGGVMARVIDLECEAPASMQDPAYQAVNHGRPGTPFPEPLERPEGYGFDNYQHVFTGGVEQAGSAAADDGGLKKLVADMALEVQPKPDDEN